jgi:hypothetical protein
LGSTSKSFLEIQSHLVHYICREYFALLTEKFYKYFNFDFVYLNVLKKEYDDTPPYGGPSRLKLYLDSMDVKSKFLKEEILNYSEPRDPGELRRSGFPTMGVLTTAHVAACIGYKDITVVGLDFF